ncbi:MAG: proprotein convertase P-domain-containing protein [Planctomycetota bacterium]
MLGTQRANIANRRARKTRGTVMGLVVFAVLSAAAPLRAQFGVAGLSCETDAAASTIALEWSPVGALDEIEIHIDGALAATLGGAATSHLLTGVAHRALEICVQPVASARGPLAPACCHALVYDEVWSTSPALPIGAAGATTTESVIAVTSGLTSGDLQVRVVFEHEFVADVSFELIAPNDQRVELWPRGRSGSGAFDVIFGVAGDEWPTATSVSLLRPVNTLELYDLYGLQTAGNWTLRVVDRHPELDTGQLVSWSLYFYAAGPARPVANLSCVAAPAVYGALAAAWTNPSVYDSISVRLNNVVVAVLPGSATNFMSAVQFVPRPVELSIEPTVAGVALEPRRCSMYLQPDVIFGLACQPQLGSTPGALLTWSSAYSPASIFLWLDGDIQAVLPGATTQHFIELETLRTYRVRVEAAFGGLAVDGEECTITLSADSSSRCIIVRGELISGAIDSASALADALTALGEAPAIIDELDADVIGTPRALWYVAGTYPENRAMSFAEGAQLAALVSAGVPIYFESNDAWGFDAPTPFAEFDGVASTGVVDGDDSFLGMEGHDFASARFAGISASYSQESVNDESTDRLIAAPAEAAGGSAGVVWTDDGAGGDPSAYATGIYYDTAPGFGKVLSQSFEFGGIDGDHTQIALGYLAALLPEIYGAIPRFRRGDANGDSAFNLADAVFALSALFSSGATPTCGDAADANDDGALDLADVIHTLNALYLGGPLPPSPGPFTCGFDSLPDLLSCSSHPLCP